MRYLLALLMLAGGAGWVMRTAEAVSIPDSVSIPIQVTRESYNHAHFLCNTYMKDREGFMGVVTLDMVVGKKVILPCSVVEGK